MRLTIRLMMVLMLITVVVGTNAQSISDQVAALKYKIDTSKNIPYKHPAPGFVSKPYNIFNHSDAEIEKEVVDLIKNVADSFPITLTDTVTLTNKNLIPRKDSAISHTTSYTINIDYIDDFYVSSQSGSLLINNPIGTPVTGKLLNLFIKDNGTPISITYGDKFVETFNNPLPSITIANKWVMLYFKYFDGKYYIQIINRQ